MIQHLTDDQIARWISGQRSPSDYQHIVHCDVCTLEVNNYRGALDRFGMALRSESDRRAAWRDLTIKGVSRSASVAAGLFTSGAQLDATSPASAYSRVFSFALHALLVVLLMLPFTVSQVPFPFETFVVVLSPANLSLPVMPDRRANGGGGGGGNRSVAPPSLGVPPRGADKQIVPPMVEPRNLLPELVVESTVVAPQLAQLAPFSFNTIGDPNGVAGPPSAGPGTGGGIGTGDGHGVGEGQGPGVGPGRGGGVGGNIFHVGGGISPPRILRQREPEYSEAGRKARAQGTVELLIVVSETGSVQVLDIVRRLGYGLDEKAVEAVRTWTFEPGMSAGKPVPVYVSVLVNFSLR